MSEESQSFIKTPRQLITVVILAFVVPITIISLVVHYVDFGTRHGAGADAMTPEAIEARIRPVAGFELADAAAPAGAAQPAQAAAPTPAAVQVAQSAPAATSAPAADGKKVYDGTCHVCHGTGVAGAPKYGNKADWAPFLKTGIDAMVKNAINGIKAMPPRGGNASLTDEQMRAAVEYMAAAAK